jgi:4-hydroxy-2-oxoglutarate aldolase
MSFTSPTSALRLYFLLPLFPKPKHKHLFVLISMMTASSVTNGHHDDSNGYRNGGSTSNQHARRRTETRRLARGIYVPTVAFFKPETDTVDVEAVERHVARLARTGIAGLVTHGSNGEAVHLDHAERMVINSATRRALDSAGCTHLPVIVGCGAQSTRETIQLCREAAQSGGSYALVLPPSYYSSLVTTDLLLGHFQAVADASPIPLLIYNFPGAVSGLDINSDEILLLSQHPNIVGVKLTCGNTGKLARVAAAAKSDFLVTGGSADFILQTLVVGGHGVIAGLANLAPRACVKIMDLYMRGEIAEAQQLQAVVARGDWAAIKGGFVAVKSALEMFYGYGGVPRRPCAAPGKQARVAMWQEFSEVIELEKGLQSER